MLARVIELHPGKDGKVKVATVNMTTTIVKRPIVKLAKLPIDSVVELDSSRPSGC